MASEGLLHFQDCWREGISRLLHWSTNPFNCAMEGSDDGSWVSPVLHQFRHQFTLAHQVLANRTGRSRSFDTFNASDFRLFRSQGIVFVSLPSNLERACFVLFSNPSQLLADWPWRKLGEDSCSTWTLQYDSSCLWGSHSTQFPAERQEANKLRIFTRQIGVLWPQLLRVSQDL